MKYHIIGKIADIIDQPNNKFAAKMVIINETNTDEKFPSTLCLEVNEKGLDHFPTNISTGMVVDAQFYVQSRSSNNGSYFTHLRFAGAKPYESKTTVNLPDGEAWNAPF